MAKAPKPTPVPETDQGAAAIDAAAPEVASEAPAPSEPAVQEEALAGNIDAELESQSEAINQEPKAIKIRLRSARFPYRRAGHVFSAAGAWDEKSLERNAENIAALIAWIEDPAIKVEGFDGDEWGPIDEVNAELREMANQAIDGE